MSKRLLTFFLSGLLLLAMSPGSRAAALEATELVPVGHTIGIKLFSQGVLVIGLTEVEENGKAATPALDCGLQVGDVIEEVGGTEVESSEQFSRLIQCGGTVELAVSREGEDLTLTAEPVQGEDGTYRLGAWIRDSVAGIGTVTFYDPATGTFGALGHGITDTDTGLLMPLGDGSVMDATVKAVKRGESGDPGELRGSFNLTEDAGTVFSNTDQGVFGVLEDSDIQLGEAVPVATSGEIHTGAALVRCNVSGDAVEDYSVEIVRVLTETDSQNLLLRVTDERLLEQTGGIVQGMSGSPILQDGKLVGAVTHVMVGDPEKGYGITIENMLSACQVSA